MQDAEPFSYGLEDTVDTVCGKVADAFRVKQTEVALLELRGKLLHFVFPAELKTAGAIPISSSAVAARTAQTKKAELFNSFTEVNHFSVFELVKIGDSGLDDQVIQKLMSAPILNSTGDVLGVIQISRKGPRPTIAGPDFTAADLQKLEKIARFLSRFVARSRARAQAAGQP
ncbi:MAG TPA: GAF domain-containing protein [Terriglobales bacterium]|nr:GAF domain-containing protein [Terriglobales bacterium]